MVVRSSTIESSPARLNSRRAIAWGEALTLLALSSFMAISVVVIGPRLLRGASLASSSETQLSASLLEQETTLRALLQKSSSILAIHFTEPHAAQLDTLVLWVSDDRYPGRVNLSEVLVIRFSPLLRSVIAYTWSPDAELDSEVAGADLRDLHRLEELAGRSDVVRAVIAQPVLACEVTGISTAQPVRPDTSDGPLGLMLTWFDESTDSRDVSTIRTELHLLDRSNRF